MFEVFYYFITLEVTQAHHTLVVDKAGEEISELTVMTVAMPF